MNKKSLLEPILAILVCVVVILAMPFDVTVKLEGELPAIAGPVQPTNPPAAAQPQATPAPEQTTTATPQNQDATTTTAAPSTDAPSSNGVMTDTKEIIDKYTLLVNKFKQEKPAYKKKEYQELPEEFRNLGTAGNLILNIASGYITSEADAEEFVRPANSEEIKWEMPIKDTESGCLLTDYDAVEWAKCEDLGDGTYKISFSLKEEMNAEPTPADTLVPVSKHGAVMQPISRNEILTEVGKITEKFPIITLNDFSLCYRECVFECVYNPETDQVKSITHHIVIDINADLKVTLAAIAGSARLYNEMLIYDITW